MIRFLFLAGAILLFTSCEGNRFDKQYFSGQSEDNIVHIELEAIDGAVKGIGFHRKANCEEFAFELRGDLNEKNSFTFDEILIDKGKLFGSVVASYDEQDKTLSYNWKTFGKDKPFTIRLEQNKYSSQEFLSILPECQKPVSKRKGNTTRSQKSSNSNIGGIFELLGRKAGQEIDQGIRNR